MTDEQWEVISEVLMHYESSGGTDLRREGNTVGSMHVDPASLGIDQASYEQEIVTIGEDGSISQTPEQRARELEYARQYTEERIANGAFPVGNMPANEMAGVILTLYNRENQPKLLQSCKAYNSLLGKGVDASNPAALAARQSCLHNMDVGKDDGAQSWGVSKRTQGGKNSFMGNAFSADDAFFEAGGEEKELTAWKRENWTGPQRQANRLFNKFGYSLETSNNNAEITKMVVAAANVDPYKDYEGDVQALDPQEQEAKLPEFDNTNPMPRMSEDEMATSAREGFSR